VRLLVSHGCMHPNAARASWVLLPALNRALRGAKAVLADTTALAAASVVKSASPACKVLADLEANGVSSLPQVQLEQGSMKAAEVHGCGCAVPCCAVMCRALCVLW